jgi:ethylbenzene dioxygenase alpha subunit
VCHTELGNTRAFVCNYHGWSFSLDGRLTGVHEKAAFDASSDFRMADHRLPTATKVSSYKGLVFASFAEDGPSLDDYLGDFRWYLDILLDNDDGGTELLPGTFKNVFRCNWKIPEENFVGDALHAGWTHESGAMAMLNRSVAPGTGVESYQINFNGHAWQSNLDYPVGNAATFGDPSVLSYFRQRQEFVRQRLGDLRSKMVAAISSGAVFPNFSFLPGQATLRVWHPRGPYETELHSWVLVNRNYPKEIKEAYRKGVMMTFSPTGVFEMDDGENWEFSSRTTGYRSAQPIPLYYGLGAGTAIDHPELKGHVFNGQINDSNQRAFYKKWMECMEGRP